MKTRKSVWFAPVLGAVASLLIVGCAPSDMGVAQHWKLYRNLRYGFEFPYPDTWEVAPLVSNQDGQLYRDPHNAEVKILGWASKISPEVGTDLEQARQNLVSSPNFVTTQGLRGHLRVEIGAEVSVMTLTLTRGEVVYSWQGRSPSDEFAGYYQFFYYVASHYRVFDDGN